MRIFREIVIWILIFWLSLPLPLFIAPETAEDELVDRPVVSVLLKKQKEQKAQKDRPGFLSKIQIKAQSIQPIKPLLSIGWVMSDDLLQVEQYLKTTLFYFWQSLIKPTRQLLWQMTTQMQRYLMKKIASGSGNNRIFIGYFEDLSHKIETILDKTNG